MITIVKDESHEWQEPVITEKYSFELVVKLSEYSQFEFAYYGIPWATYLDLYEKIYKDEFGDFLDFFCAHSSVKGSSNSPNNVTVCQSIYFRRILPTLGVLGINILFCPHAVMAEYQLYYYKYGIHVLPYAHYPVAYEDKVLSENRDFLYSFVGCTKYGGFSAYANRAEKVRTAIVHLNHPDNTKIIARDGWHFEKEVYDRQIRKLEINESDRHTVNEKFSEYLEIMLRSTFCLCPLGTGPSSIRIFESLVCGAIPVIISDDIWMPEIGIDWNKYCVFVSESEIGAIPKILQDITSVSSMIEAVMELRMIVGKESLISPIVHLFNEIEQSQITHEKIKAPVSWSFKKARILPDEIVLEQRFQEELAFERQLVSDWKNKFAHCNKVNSDLQNQIFSLKVELENNKNIQQSILTSTSWRITKPLRQLGSFLESFR